MNQPPNQKENSESNRKRGYAQIKSEYLLVNYKPTLKTEYLSKEIKEKIASEGKFKTQVDDDVEPPSKKFKLKGRNKQRPRNERIEQKDKLCPALRDGRDCKFGDNCKFNHDVKDFMEKKRPDIEGKCPVFETWGFCRHGVTCRFASSHLGENNENLVNKELHEKMKDKPRFLNPLSDEVRFTLWQKDYDFKMAAKSFQIVQQSYTASKPDGGTQTDPVIKPATNPVTDTVSGSSSNTSDKVCDVSTDDVPKVCDVKTEDVPKVCDVVSTDPVPKVCDVSTDPVPKVCDVSTDPVPKVCDVSTDPVPKVCDVSTDDIPIRLNTREVKKIDFKNKLSLAPLTTVGNLPFRRICKTFGADITCSEMALAAELIKGKGSEWSLIKRHPSEDIFGAQICGAYPDLMTRCAQLLTEQVDLDFIDINCGCPIDMIYKKGSGSALMGKATKLEQMCRSMRGVMGDTPLTVKLRTGVQANKNVAHNIIPRLRDAGVSLVTIHGRSREQRYTKLADWDYIDQCARLGDPMPVFGNGDVLTYEDANLQMQRNGVSGLMLARGALIKPWVFTEIKEQRHWDISSSERLDILRSYANYGMEHWGSDHQGVENTRRFLLEWLSFLHRYIPVGVLDQVPQKINERPPYYIGRNDLETMMASANCADWIKISEMLLGPVPTNFQFLPKHKANAYQ